MVMSAFTAFGFAALCLAFAAVELSTFLDPQWAGAGTSASVQAPLLDSAAEVFLPLAALGVLFVAVALIYHHLMARSVVVAVPVAGASNGRLSISTLLMFAALCVSAGTLELIVFGQAAGAGCDGCAGHGAQARALGLSSLRVLPAAATVTFFCGMMLIFAAHVPAGGEAGRTGAVAGDDPVQGLLRILTVGMAAALVGLMVIALTLHGAKY